MSTAIPTNDNESNDVDRFDLLARPNSRKVTEKYHPEKYNEWRTGVAPNALVGKIPSRIDQLAQPSDRSKIRKYHDDCIPTSTTEDATVDPNLDKKPHTSRIPNLAVPKEYIVVDNLKNYQDEFPKLGEQLKRVYSISRKRTYKLHHCKPTLEPTPILKAEMYNKKYVPPKINEKKRKKELAKWSVLRSKPKKEYVQNIPTFPSKPLKQLEKRLNTLSLPVSKNITAKYDMNSHSPLYMKVKPSALNFIATPRLENLAKPLKRYQQKQSFYKQFKVSEKAKQYNATPRINELSKPHKNNNTQEKTNPYKVKSAALVAVPTKRTEELSVPKERLEIYIKNAFEVNKKALKANATTRVQQLAKPKELYYKSHSSTDFDNQKSGHNRHFNISRLEYLAKPKYVTHKF